MIKRGLFMAPLAGVASPTASSQDSDSVDKCDSSNANPERGDQT
jgi:hypothetical protein